MQVLICDERFELAEAICSELTQAAWDCQVASSNGPAKSEPYAVVFHREYDRRHAVETQLAQGLEMLPRICAESVRRLVLLSSSAVYQPKHSNPGRILESRATTSRHPNQYAEFWQQLERGVEQFCSERSQITLTILRPSTTLTQSGQDLLNNAFRSGKLLRLVGYDPPVQLLSPRDLAHAIQVVLKNPSSGTFNVAPRGVIPLRRALKQAKVRGLAIPWLMQKPIRLAMKKYGWASPDEASYLKYSFTVSSKKLIESKGYEPTSTSQQTLEEFLAQNGRSYQTGHQSFDDFGLDESYVRWHGRWLFRFLEKVYWRISTEGFDNVPASGGAVMVGIHRGFMPLDGVMLVHLLCRHTNRIPRVLIHPALVKFPILAEFLSKIGGIIANQQNAEDVLRDEEILGVFPEGMRGAFRMYRDAYRLDNFGRSDYVKFAIKNRVPIIPFVFLGPVETFPILGRIKWKWWKRHTEWPFFPLTPTWPIFPIPLPAKWKLRILPPIEVGPDDDERRVDNIHEHVRRTIEAHLSEMRRQRKSIF